MDVSVVVDEPRVTVVRVVRTTCVDDPTSNVCTADVAVPVDVLEVLGLGSDGSVLLDVWIAPK